MIPGPMIVHEYTSVITDHCLLSQITQYYNPVVFAGFWLWVVVMIEAEAMRITGTLDRVFITTVNLV